MTIPDFAVWPDYTQCNTRDAKAFSVCRTSDGNIVVGVDVGDGVIALLFPRDGARDLADMLIAQVNAAIIAPADDYQIHD